MERRRGGGLRSRATTAVAVAAAAAVAVAAAASFHQIRSTPSSSNFDSSMQQPQERQRRRAGVPSLRNLGLAAAVSALVAAQGGEASRVAKSTGKPSFFLQDPTDGSCLAGGEFKRCAIDTLWFVQGKPGHYQIHHRPVEETDEELCLDK